MKVLITEKQIDDNEVRMLTVEECHIYQNTVMSG